MLFAVTVLLCSAAGPCDPITALDVHHLPPVVGLAQCQRDGAFYAAETGLLGRTPGRYRLRVRCTPKATARG
ncbi:hypothetical protein ATO13_22461 [Stappia sp. 22II-S9-Z10]|nr:hypothetical protein ATO13_22461 [Stappia sp. 22II-S9-Z10]